MERHTRCLIKRNAGKTRRLVKRLIKRQQTDNGMSKFVRSQRERRVTEEKA